MHMKTATRIFPIVFFLFLVCGLTRCSKKESPPPAHSGNNNPADPAPGTGGASSCNTKAADAETISIFPSDNPWHQDISHADTDAYNTQILSKYSGTGLHADFGSGLYDGKIIGIPFIVVCSSQQKLVIKYRGNGYDDNYGNESDPGPYPIPLSAPIEPGDGHVIAVDKDNSLLYELYNANVNGDHWEASSGAIFDLKSNKLRQDGWTSADAAGLPIFPGLVRYDEMLKGTINHALRFTLAKSHTVAAHISPARHEGNGTGTMQTALPFGARLRLKASYDISHFSPHLQVILTAMKKYGLILADIGSDMYLTGATDERWDNDELQKLGTVKASSFEVIKFN